LRDLIGNRGKAAANCADLPYQKPQTHGKDDIMIKETRKNESVEIISYNKKVRSMRKLLELDSRELGLATGGATCPGLCATDP
jgi:hypothetical protein